ncbi:hypothetical protein CI610_00906 [invertebrate metagenome]|uniref:Phosphotransferase system EIIC domain-containing protein n=1 Tax=invertebrate metagenome TaxID=1711999 RepID=A0A2H9TA09_9ZZZZ
MNSKESRFSSFLAKKKIHICAKSYLIDAMSYMGLGLFSSLLIGTILNTLGSKLGIPFLSETLWPIARDMTGPAIGVAIALSLKAPPLVIFAATIAGASGNALGGPVAAYVSTILATECGKLVSGETVLDIVITPSVTAVIGVATSLLIGPQMGTLMTGLGDVIIYATELQPFAMGVLIAVIMGMVLTLPISSAAICIMLGLHGLAAGAATVGCCAQMVGFAVISFRDNGWSGIFAQGLGTSMLQIPNIIRNWKIWLPSILSSAVLGPIATVYFKLVNTPIGAGMGTAGLVGPLETLPAMEKSGHGSMESILIILLICFVLPAILTLIFSVLLRKAGWIKEGDMALNLTPTH